MQRQYTRKEVGPGQKVMLDQDLAELYGVTTGNLNLAVRRNKVRFPEDFMFQLNAQEMESLLLQSAGAKERGGRRTPPYAFTEQGVAMLSSVLRAQRAVLVNIVIMRAFVKLREMLSTHRDATGYFVLFQGAICCWRQVAVAALHTKRPCASPRPPTPQFPLVQPSMYPSSNCARRGVSRDEALFQDEAAGAD